MKDRLYLKWVSSSSVEVLICHRWKWKISDYSGCREGITFSKKKAYNKANMKGD
jgi:hypothetical protein